MTRKCLKLALVVASAACSAALAQTIGIPLNGYPEYIFPLDQNGWTVINPTATTSGTCAAGTADGSCIVYVANNATCIAAGTCTDNSAQCKLYAPPITDTPATMCLTFATALTKKRSGKPDWVMLHRGDTFPIAATIIDQTGWGTSPQRPSVFTAYPRDPISYDDRPIIDVCHATGQSFIQQQSGTINVAIISWRITNSCADPNSANYWTGSLGGQSFRLFGRIDFMLMEDIYFSYLAGIQPGSSYTSSNMYYRRNVYYNPSAPTSGVILAHSYYNFLVEDNLIYYDYTLRESTPASITLAVGSPAVITYPATSATVPSLGGMPPGGAFSTIPQVLLQGSGLLVGPVMTVSGAASGTGGVVRLTVNSTTGVATGDTVSITSTIGGITISNTEYIVTVVDGTHLELQGQAFSGTYTSGGTVTGGMFAATTNCSHTNQCVYLCSIAGTTANISRSSTCATTIKLPTGGISCTAGCTSQWQDLAANIFSHNLYNGNGWDATPAVATTGGLVYRNNISCYASATGSMPRPGGTVYNNLLCKNPINLTGMGNRSEYSYNVIIESIGMQQANSPESRGGGINIDSQVCTAPAAGVCTAAMVASPLNQGPSGSTIHHNIIAQNQGNSSNSQAFTLNPAGVYHGDNIANQAAVTGVTVQFNIICDWPTGNISPNTPYYNPQGLSNTVDNTNLPDPTTSNTDHTCASLGISSPMSIGQYYDSVIGGSGHTTDQFLDAAKDKWSKTVYDPAYHAPAVNNAIRPTYGMANP